MDRLPLLPALHRPDAVDLADRPPPPPPNVQSPPLDIPQHTYSPYPTLHPPPPDFRLPPADLDPRRRVSARRPISIPAAGSPPPPISTSRRRISTSRRRISASRRRISAPAGRSPLPPADLDSLPAGSPPRRHPRRRIATPGRKSTSRCRWELWRKRRSKWELWRKRKSMWELRKRSYSKSKPKTVAATASKCWLESFPRHSKPKAGVGAGAASQWGWESITRRGRGGQPVGLGEHPQNLDPFDVVAATTEQISEEPQRS